MNRPGNKRPALPCQRLGIELFFPDLEDADVDITPATAACGECEQNATCLNDALTHGVKDGIWAGILFDVADKEIKVAAEALEQGDGEQLVGAIKEAQEATRRFITGEKREREWTPRRQCDRCDSYVEAGYHPEDENGPNATCSLPSTYNKGCRCQRCKEGKAAYHARSR